MHHSFHLQKEKKEEKKDEMKRFLHASLFESKPKNFLFHWEKYEIIFPNMFFSYFRACIAYLSPKRLFSKRDSITLIYKGGV